MDYMYLSWSEKITEENQITLFIFYASSITVRTLCIYVQMKQIADQKNNIELFTYYMISIRRRTLCTSVEVKK
jgi:hypothetical protein